MPLLDGPSLGGNARHVLRQYAEESALARGRAANAAGTEEFGGGCLRGRYNNLREVIQNNPSLVVVPSIINAGGLFVQRPICRTNYLPNNSMAGATGGVLPTNWSIASLPAGITVSYSASGTAVAADGTSVNYIDVTVSGTAGASGFLNIRPNPSSSTIAAFVGQTWNTSVYLQLISGSVTSISPTWQLQELNSSQTFLQGSNIGGLGSLVVGGQFDRYNVSRVLTESTTAFVTCRWGHSLLSGTAYSYTLRIGSPQLERFSIPTPMIATSTGAVTRLNESTNVVGLPPDFTVSRNTGATRVGPNGLIETAKTNLTLRSQEFDVTPTWSRNLGGTGLLPSVTANSVISPDGSQTAETIVFNRGAGNTVNDRSFLEQSVTIPTTGTYILSVYAKASTAGDVGKQIFIRLGGAGSLIAITLTANWTRYSQSEASVASGSQVVQIGNRGTFTADNSVSVDLWGAQLETGSTASEYIPTTTVARTRFAGVTVDGTIAANIPRIDWLGQSCPALLVEPSATNFARWVNQMTAQDTPTASGGMTITTGSTDFLAPDGTSGSINKYVGGAASGNSQYAYYTGAGIVVTASGQHTFSLFVKAGATNPLNFCTLNFTAYSGGSGTATSYFSLASGTALTAGASIQDYGNGWYRLISAPYTIASGDLNGTLLFGMAEANNDTSWPASGALNLTAYTWGAQLETGSIATTYIPTTSGTGSRAADVISASGALVSGLIGQTEGTIYAEVDFRNLGYNGAVITVQTDNWITNSIQIQKSLGNQWRFTIRAATTLILNIDAGTITAGIYKVALAYNTAASGTVLAVNGSILSTQTASSIPVCNSVVLGARNETGTFSVQLNDRIRAAALYNTRLTNDQLAELTRL